MVLLSGSCEAIQERTHLFSSRNRMSRQASSLPHLPSALDNQRNEGINPRANSRRPHMPLYIVSVVMEARIDDERPHDLAVVYSGSSVQALRARWPQRCLPQCSHMLMQYMACAPCAEIQCPHLDLDLRLEITKRSAPEVRLIELQRSLADPESTVTSAKQLKDGIRDQRTQWTRTKPSSAPEAYALPWGWTASVFIGPLQSR